TLLLEYRFGIQFTDKDHTVMNIKADTHTCRVLYRLGIAEDKSTDSAINAARRLNPEYPGAIDGVLWVVGRTWCHSTRPKCIECPLESVCAF
ncbi:MAG: iron-sulfur cluster loop, partial [Anaerolineae bacterium]|nr:iron-sulfur cluster loop [Anaerolineae bacterium]